jgi:hypothetical protein
LGGVLHGRRGLFHVSKRLSFTRALHSPATPTT